MTIVIVIVIVMLKAILKCFVIVSGGEGEGGIEGGLTVNSSADCSCKSGQHFCVIFFGNLTGSVFKFDFILEAVKENQGDM